MKEQLKIIKALGDSNRLKIVEMISCYEMCSMDILEKLQISQPTLSHHMKIIVEAGLVSVDKRGKCTYYELKQDVVSDFQSFIKKVMEPSESCICMEVEDEKK